MSEIPSALERENTSLRKDCGERNERIISQQGMISDLVKELADVRFRLARVVASHANTLTMAKAYVRTLEGLRSFGLKVVSTEDMALFVENIAAAEAMGGGK